MQRMMMNLVFSALLFPAALQLRGAEDQPPATKQEQAQVLWEEAFRHYEQGMAAGVDQAQALRELAQARALFNQIATEHPQYERPAVLYRIQECTKKLNQLADAGGVLERSLEQMTPAELRADLEKTRVEREKYSRAMMILYRQNGELKRERELLQGQLRQAQDQIASGALSGGRLDELRLQVARLEAQLQEKEADLARLRRKLEDSAPEDLIKERKTLAERLATLESREQEFNKALQDLEGFKGRQEVRVNELLAELDRERRSHQDTRTELANETQRSKTSLTAIDDIRSQMEKSRKEYAQAQADMAVLLRRVNEAQKREADMRKSLTGGTGSGAELADLRKSLDEMKLRVMDAENKVNLSVAAERRMEQQVTERDNVVAQLRQRLEQIKSGTATEETSSAVALRTEHAVMRQERDKAQEELATQLRLTTILNKRIEDLLAEVAKRGGGTDPAVSVAGSDELQRQLKLNEERRGELERQLLASQQEAAQLRKAAESGDQQLLARYIALRDENEALRLKVGLAPQATQAHVQELSLQPSTELDALLREGVKAATAGEANAALGCFNRVLEKDPGNFQALMRAGLIYYEQKLNTEAERYLSKAFYKSPDDSVVLLALGTVLIERGRYEMAVSMLSRAAALKPDDYAIRLNLGTAFQALGWEEAALAEMEKAWELNNKSADAAMNLAVLYLAAHPPRKEKARALYRTAIGLGGRPNPVLERIFKEEAPATP